jgi:hypothetical protein
MENHRFCRRYRRGEADAEIPSSGAAVAVEMHMNCRYVMSAEKQELKFYYLSVRSGELHD